MPDPEGPTFGTRPIYDARTECEMVELALGSEAATVEPFMARDIAAFLVNAASAAEGPTFGILSTYGPPAERGLVVLALGEMRALVAPTRAREMAAMLAEAASAAEARRAIAQDRDLPDLPDDEEAGGS